MHPGIKVQFELDMQYGPSALMCKQCHRWNLPDSKFPSRLPPKTHPPQACGMTIFGSKNDANEVRELAAAHNASLVVLLRRNHVAHAISAFRQFVHDTGGQPPTAEVTVPWAWGELVAAASEKRAAYDRLLSYGATGRPTHLILYEDLKARPAQVWDGLQAFLGVPRRAAADIDKLQARSSARPPIEHLERLGELQGPAAGTEWEAMVADPGYDDRLDVAAEFARICGRLGAAAARVSWRGGTCAALAGEEARARTGR